MSGADDGPSARGAHAVGPRVPNSFAQLDMQPEAGADAGRILASLPQAVVLLSPGLCIQAVNPAAEQFFGQSQRRLAGQSLDAVMELVDTRLAARLLDHETPLSAREVAANLRGRGRRRIDINLAPLADMPGWQVLSVHDNSPTEALGEDSGTADNAALRGPEIIAHEIKNPLAGIRGAAQLLARKLDDRDRALTDLITGEVDRIATLIENMQELSRRTRAPVEPCNLHVSARRAIDVIEAGRVGCDEAVRVSQEFDPSLPSVLGNPDGLVQIIINLLSNAIEACSGAQHARVSIRSRFASGLQLYTEDCSAPLRLPVELRITDNGPGVERSMREHIFEPFVTSKKSGQGLGLPLVRKLVREMNGRISHERDEERGLTHFRVHLPVAGEREPGRISGETTA